MRTYHCEDAEHAASVAAEIRGPIALKGEFAVPPRVDIDVVLLGLEGAESVRAGWRELERRAQKAGVGLRWLGAVVQPLVPPGANLLVGSLTDPELGPVIGHRTRWPSGRPRTLRRFPDDCRPPTWRPKS